MATSILTKASVSSTELGYKLTVRNGVPARHYNDPAAGEKAANLIAHDWQHHGYNQGTLSDNVDELVAIGAQYIACPWFIEDNGGIADFIGYQLAGIASKGHDWEILNIYNQVDEDICFLVANNWDDIIDHTNTYMLKDMLDGKYATLDAVPADLKENKSLFMSIVRLLTRGKRYMQTLYKSEMYASQMYLKLVDTLYPYVSNVTENSPEVLRLQVNIQAGTVVIR